MAAIDHKHDGRNLGDIEGFQGIQAPVFSDINECFSKVEADVLIDLTTPEVGMYHTETALNYGIRPVVGTTGFTKG